MVIGIDASRYGEPEATGVEHYSRQIIDGIIGQVKKNSKLKLVLYSKKRLFKTTKQLKNHVIREGRLWTLWKLSREMRKNPPDVLFVPSHVLPLSRPKKSVITIHDTAFRHFREAYSFFQYHYLNWSTAYAVKHAWRIIVPSQATSRDLQKFFQCPPEKIVVIPHGFSAPRENKNVVRSFILHKWKNFVFFVGRLETKKNILALLQAFSDFLKTHPDYRLILGGKRGIGFPQILKKAIRRNLLRNVIMPGYLTEAEKQLLYKNCRFFVFPSLYEGFGLPVQEAFYYGKAVLLSDTSSLPEVGGKAALYCDPHNIDRIRNGMEQLADDRELRENLGRLGKKRLKLFSWENCAHETLKVLTGKNNG